MKPLIVICSHDAEFYLILSHILAVDGFTSALASNVDEILHMTTETPVHALVLDCRPDNDMVQSCSRLTQDARTPRGRFDRARCRDPALRAPEVRNRRKFCQAAGAGKATCLPAFKAGDRPAIRIATARH